MRSERVSLSFARVCAGTQVRETSRMVRAVGGRHMRQVARSMSGEGGAIASVEITLAGQALGQDHVMQG
jgi:hypothetical protein